MQPQLQHIDCTFLPLQLLSVKIKIKDEHSLSFTTSRCRSRHQILIALLFYLDTNVSRAQRLTLATCAPPPSVCTDVRGAETSLQLNVRRLMKVDPLMKYIKMWDCHTKTISQPASQLRRDQQSRGEDNVLWEVQQRRLASVS